MRIKVLNKVEEGPEPGSIFNARRIPYAFGEKFQIIDDGEFIGFQIGLNSAIPVGDLPTYSESVIQSVLNERKFQDAKWGEQNHDPTVWLGILGEEFGELCQAVNETWFDNGPGERQKGGYENMRAEAVQVAAVAVSLIECLDRRHGGERL